jgi:hypothetical protein
VIDPLMRVKSLPVALQKQPGDVLAGKNPVMEMRSLPVARRPIKKAGRPPVMGWMPRKANLWS